MVVVRALGGAEGIGGGVAPLAARVATSQRSSAMRRSSAHGPAATVGVGRVGRQPRARLDVGAVTRRRGPADGRADGRSGGASAGARSRRVADGAAPPDRVAAVVAASGDPARDRPPPRGPAGGRPDSGAGAARSAPGSRSRVRPPRLADAAVRVRRARGGRSRPAPIRPDWNGRSTSEPPAGGRASSRSPVGRAAAGRVRRRVATKASSARVAARRRGTASGATVTLTSRRAAAVPGGPRRGRRRVTTPSTRPRARKANSLAVTLPASSRRVGESFGVASVSSAGGSAADVTDGRQLDAADRGSRPGGSCRPAGPDGRFGAVGARADPPVRARARTARKGTSPLGHRPAQEFLVQPVDASWLQCNIECQEACPGRDELPRLPQPRRRGPVRGGLHPVARAEPGRGDVLVRLLGPVRAGLPPRRHRPPAGDPGDEAVPRRVARGLRHPRRHAPDHAARRSASPSSAPGRPGSPSPASWR